jgi:hypothetical protein
MAARLWTALLMLAAVFAIHGLQCTSAAHGAADGPGQAPTAAVAMTASTLADGHLAGAAAPSLTDSLAGQRTVPDSPAVAATDAGHDTRPHGSTGHLWTLCLAVLAAGIAALLALLAHGLIGRAPPALRRACACARGWCTPPRPPDLFALCLLRT